MGLLAEQRYSTGRLVRTEPLPIGRYWIDIFHEPIANKSIFDTWLINGKAAGAVIIERTESRGADDGGPARDWYIFQIVKPWGWGIAEWVGWPNDAPANIQTSDDTVQKPPPEPGPFDVGGLFGSGGQLSWVPYVAGGAVLVAGIWGVARILRG